MNVCTFSALRRLPISFSACLRLLVWVTLALCSCSRVATPHSKTRTLMDTLVTVTIYDADKSAPGNIDAAFARMKELESLLNVHDPTSELSWLSRQAGKQPVTVSADTFSLLEESLRIGRLTGGAFDPTISPLVSLWKQAAQRKRLPDKRELESASIRVDYRKVILDREAFSVRLLPPVSAIDLGGIAKGYAAEEAARLLLSRGVGSALVEPGGDIFALGTKPGGKPWVVGVQNPFEESDFITRLSVSDAAVVTSGNYRRFFEIEGRRFSHIIDPRTGWPADLVPSVTVIAPHGAEADALATAVSVLGVDAGLELVESLPETECLLVTGDKDSFKLVRSSSFSKYEVPADKRR